MQRLKITDIFFEIDAVIKYNTHAVVKYNTHLFQTDAMIKNNERRIPFRSNKWV